VAGTFGDVFGSLKTSIRLIAVRRFADELFDSRRVTRGLNLYEIYKQRIIMQYEL